MTVFLILLSICLAVAVAVLTSRRRHLEVQLSALREEAGRAAEAMQRAYEQKLEELAQESARVQAHYETEAMKIHAEASRALAEMEPWRAYAEAYQSEAAARAAVAEALQEAAALRVEIEAWQAQAKQASADERREAQARARELRAQAEAMLAQATREAGRLVAAAERSAQEIAGDAYTALREHRALEQAITAIRNVVEGYGDRYVVPTHSVLDDLAADFTHTAAGEALRTAREHSRRMVEQGEAAACEYADGSRRETAQRFVIDAFNGRVDAVLSTVRHDNIGTLEQQIRDAFALVNLNGQAFRQARILPAYLESRLAELKWSVVVQELKRKEREEQRLIQERIREEEKARRDYERALQEAAREEAAIKQAMERAQAAAAKASEEERAKFEAQFAELNARLVAAEAKGQRALSMAQQTRSGNVYVISNIGSFGEEVFKIGMTRRLEPLDRIKELGDASVPFEFDVHAMIKSEDAPALERLLHEQFEDWRINKVNYRKEFFRLPLERVRAFAEERGLEATFTMVAEAREYRETQALERMTPEERARYRMEEPEEVLAGDEG